MVLGSSGQVVAVGVDESTEAAEAARYAARVAADRGWDLLVVHGYTLPPATPGVTAEMLRDAHEAGEELVDQVLAGARVGPRTHVLRLVTATAVVATLREVSHDASLLVLGRHHFDLVTQLLVGRVGSAVVAKAACPVVVVPPGWSRRRTSGGPVVVALDVETPAREPLRLAFDEAERTGAAVVALHAFPLGEAASGEEQVALEEVLAGAKQDHPDVAVHTRLVPGEPVAGIVEESVRASLVVVGRPHHERLGAWSASVARAVTDRSLCPLLVAPPSSSEGDPATSGGAAGRARR